MKITPKGQVTIPIEIREKLGFLPHSEVEFEIVGETVRIRKARNANANGEGRRRESLVARLRGKGSVGLTTDETLALTRGDD